MKHTSHLALTFAVAFAANACTLEKKDDASAYREAIPQAEAVVVDGPETSPGQSSTMSGSSGLQAEGAPLPGNWAFWYGFTREVRDGVNHVTAGVLGSVWYIVHTEPTEVGDDQATWGPYTDALEPVTWRFRVTRVAEEHYQYVLEGRPKTSASERDYQAVLYGTGYGQGSEQHGDGDFTIELDRARALDPFKHRDNSGSINITHDLPANITSELGALPRVITADVTPAGGRWFTVTSSANEDGTGRLDVDAFLDIDDSKITLAENVGIISRWNADGAGRADISIDGGDVPVDLGTVRAVECWGTDFTRVYYGDSQSFAPMEGDITACAYADPAAP